MINESKIYFNYLAKCKWVSSLFESWIQSMRLQIYCSFKQLASHIHSDEKKKKKKKNWSYFFAKKKCSLKKKTLSFLNYGIILNINTQVKTMYLWDLWSIYDTVSNDFTSLLLI